MDTATHTAAERIVLGARFKHPSCRDADGAPILCVITRVRDDLIYYRHESGPTIGAVFMWRRPSFDERVFDASWNID